MKKIEISDEATGENDTFALVTEQGSKCSEVTTALEMALENFSKQFAILVRLDIRPELKKGVIDAIIDNMTTDDLESNNPQYEIITAQP